MNLSAFSFFEATWQESGNCTITEREQFLCVESLYSYTTCMPAGFSTSQVACSGDSLALLESKCLFCKLILSRKQHSVSPYLGNICVPLRETPTMVGQHYMHHWSNTLQPEQEPFMHRSINQWDHKEMDDTVMDAGGAVRVVCRGAGTRVSSGLLTDTPPSPYTMVPWVCTHGTTARHM